MKPAECAQKPPIHASIPSGVPAGSADQVSLAEDRVEMDLVPLVSQSDNNLAFLMSNVNNNPKQPMFVREVLLTQQVLIPRN
jgi:hypothetical protein